MNKEPLVSIVTPLYNTEKFIRETIESVISQSFKNWEMLIIDDCSKDNSLEVVKSYVKSDSRIKIFQNEENLGVVKTRNRAIKIARGKYIAFLDADDLWESKKLEKQIEFMEKNKCYITYTGYEKINEDGSSRGRIEVPKEVTYKKSLKGNIMGCLTVIYNQDELGKNYFKEIKMSEDHVLWLQLLKRRKAYGIIESLARYRVLKNSRSSKKLDAIKFQWKIYKKIEGLNIYKSIYYLLIYLWRGYKRYKI